MHAARVRTPDGTPGSLPGLSARGAVQTLGHPARGRFDLDQANPVDLNQRTPVQFRLKIFSMISFKYRYPRTGQEVHGHAADDLINAEAYEPVTCTACGGTRLVDPKTGRLLEEANTG